MSSSTESIVFFGSGPVAAKALELLMSHQTIEAVITKPRPSHHKGEFPVLSLCSKYGLTTHTPEHKQELTELFKKTEFQSRVGVVIDYGIIIAGDVISSFPLGIVNSHFSLLPRWRGADPISFAILEGDTRTGVSLMSIDEQLDTGKLLVQRGLLIEPQDTTPSLTKKLILLSDELLNEYLPKYIRGQVRLRSQPHPARATYSRKLAKQDGWIDWNKSAVAIEREIRAFSGWPRSRTTIAGLDIIITEARVIPSRPGFTPGTVRIVKKDLYVGTSDQILHIIRLQPAGKKEMSGKEFLAGHAKMLDLHSSAG